MALNIGLNSVECKMNNQYLKAATWSVPNAALVNTFRHYMCTYGAGMCLSAALGVQSVPLHAPSTSNVHMHTNTDTALSCLRTSLLHSLSRPAHCRCLCRCHHAYALPDTNGTLSLYVDGILRGSSSFSPAVTSFQHGDGAGLSIFRRAGSANNLAQYANAADTLTGAAGWRSRTRAVDRQAQCGMHCPLQAFMRVTDDCTCDMVPVAAISE